MSPRDMAIRDGHKRQHRDTAQKKRGNVKKQLEQTAKSHSIEKHRERQPWTRVSLRRTSSLGHSLGTTVSQSDNGTSPFERTGRGCEDFRYNLVLVLVALQAELKPSHHVKVLAHQVKFGLRYSGAPTYDPTNQALTGFIVTKSLPICS